MSTTPLPDPSIAAVHRLARFTVASTFVLVLAGGLVTSRDAGLAVPDWPLAFGELNPPRWWQIENIRTEHGHRILAFLVASLTALLGWRILRSRAIPEVRTLGIAAMVLVLVQAVLGGLRVLHLSVDLAMIHGMTGQLFLSLLVAVVVVSSPEWTTAAEMAGADERDEGQGSGGTDATPSTAGSSTVRRLSLLCGGLVLLQLLAGLAIRHGGAEVRPLLGYGVFHLHIAGALTLLAAASRLASATGAGDPPVNRNRLRIRQNSRRLRNVVYLQLILGPASYALTEFMEYDRQASLLESWVPTFHQGLGAAALGLSVALALRSGAVPGITPGVARKSGAAGKPGATTASATNSKPAARPEAVR